MSGIKISSRSAPRSLVPPWLTGPWGMVGIIAILYTLLNIFWTYFHWGGPKYVTLIANLFSFFPSLLAVVLAWRVAAEKELSTPLRRAWFILGVSFLMFLIGNVIWAYLEVVLEVEPFPSIADVFYLAFYPFGLWGLLAMPGARQNRRESLTLWLDLLGVLTTAAMFVGYFIIVPTTASSGSDFLTQVIAPAYPIGSLLLTGGILAILYRPSSPNTQSALSLLLIGMIFFVGGDFAFGYTSLTGTYTVGGWTDASWNVAQLFFALAALRKMYHSPASAAPREWMARLNRPGRRLPAMAVALGYGLVFYVVITNYSRAAEWLMAGALLLTLLVIARQIISPAFADLPVRVKVILTFILVSVLSVGLVSATAYLTIRSNLESVVGDSLKADVEIRSQILGNEISKQLDLMEGFVLGESIENGASAASAQYIGDQATIQAQLQQQDLAWKAAGDVAPLVQDMLNNPVAQELYEFLQRFPTYTDLLLTDKYGAAIAATARPTDYYHGTQDWWQVAYNNGQGAIYISQPSFNPATQVLSVIIAIPVRTDHGSEVDGIIRTTYNLQSILEVLIDSRHEETKGGFDVLLPGGHLVTPQSDMKSLDPDTVARLQASQNADYAQLSFDGILQLVSQALVASPNAEDADVFKNLNWILIAHQEPVTAFAPLHAAWQTALLTTLFVLFLTTGLAVILAQVLMAPISRLTIVAKKIGEGDLSTKARVESRDEIGTLAGTFNSMLDTLSRAQEEVQESEALYRSLVDYSPDLILVHRDGQCLYINPAGAEMLGAKSVDQLIGRSVLDLLPPEDWELEQQDIEQTSAISQRTQLLQRKPRRLDGTTFDAEFRAIPISYAGRPAIQYVMRDITERKLAEEKIRNLLTEVARQRGDLEIRVQQRTSELNTLNLRLQDELAERKRLVQSLQESEQRFHLVFDTSPDAIFLLDPHDPTVIWRIVDCNPSACLMNGYTREELIGQSIDILNADKGGPQGFASTLGRLQNEIMLRGIEATHRHKDGHVFPIEYSTSLITVAGRELVLGIDRDITERKQVEQALNDAKELAEGANRAKSEFLSRMSHELRTPMNAILGFAQLLTMSRREPLTLIQKERVRQIVKGGQHLLDLINEVLDISRIEAGRLQISPEPVPVRESIQEVLDLTVSLAADRHIQLHVNLGTEANPYVMADRQRLKQILLNLLSNAVKYNYEGGNVMISCERTSADIWRISVTDTGPGIAPENIGRLFTPFERLVANTSNVEGTGLGLALAKRLVELMHGDIGVESTVGRGGTFWVELPFAESQLAQLQRTGGTAELPVLSALSGIVMYVEDNIANFELIQQILADYDQIELLWARDPEQGMKLAYQHRPDLILLDLHLGGRDGAEVLSLLKQDPHTASIPVVIISADATHNQIQRLLSMGATAYLTKPLDVKPFVQLIEGLLNVEEG
jgi:PAS domain S-box-containing protein